jgi:hypothetical protein
VGRRGCSCLSSVWRSGDGGQKQPKQQPARSTCLCQRRGNDSTRARTFSLSFNSYLSGHDCQRIRERRKGVCYSVSVAAVCNICRQHPQPLKANQYTDVTYKQKACPFSLYYIFNYYCVHSSSPDYLYTATHN